MNKVYEIVTEKIVQMLEKGVVPWIRPWKVIPPSNLISGKPYRGINVLLLFCTAYTSPFWLTFKQAAMLGGHVKKGEKSSIVVFWKQLDRARENKSGGEDDVNDANDAPKESSHIFPSPFSHMLRYYNVFNTDQCEGLVHKRLEDLAALASHPSNALDLDQLEALEKAQEMVDSMPLPPVITHGGFTAYYSPREDRITVPTLELFKSRQGYFGTLFHEIIHATGHEKRLARKSLMEASFFGDHSYSQEELVAEIGAAFLAATAGIERDGQVENSAAYIQSWLEVFKGDRKMVVKAASEAQKAADYVLGKREEEA